MVDNLFEVGDIVELSDGDFWRGMYPHLAGQHKVVSVDKTNRTWVAADGRRHNYNECWQKMDGPW